jgi:hypothetical protein
MDNTPVTARKILYYLPNCFPIGIPPLSFFTKLAIFLVWFPPFDSEALGACYNHYLTIVFLPPPFDTHPTVANQHQTATISFQTPCSNLEISWLDIYLSAFQRETVNQ